jgi:hypothetical protein
MKHKNKNKLTELEKKKREKTLYTFISVFFHFFLFAQSMLDTFFPVKRPFCMFYALRL